MELPSKNTSLATEAEMSALYQQGEEAGFDYFFRLLYSSICYFAERLTKDREAAEDIVSTAFMKAWANHSRLNRADKIRAYIYQVTRNDCYKWVRKKQRLAELQQDLDHYSITGEEHVLTAIIHSELIRSIQRYIDEMSPAQKIIITNLYLEGKTVAELARDLNLHVSTVKTQKYRGLAVLRAKLGLGASFLLFSCAFLRLKSVISPLANGLITDL